MMNQHVKLSLIRDNACGCGVLLKEKNEDDEQDQ